jgi:hypothetical protein
MVLSPIEYSCCPCENCLVYMLVFSPKISILSYWELGICHLLQGKDLSCLVYPLPSAPSILMTCSNYLMKISHSAYST